MGKHFALSRATLASLRWGRDVSPEWVHAVEQTAPGALTALVTKAVTAGKTGYIYGFLISAQEANDFLVLIAWPAQQPILKYHTVLQSLANLMANNSWPIAPCHFQSTDIPMENTSRSADGRLFARALIQLSSASHPRFI